MPVTDVTAEAAEVTGAAAEVLVLDPVLVAAWVPEPEPVPELVLVPVAAVAELVLVPVTAELTEPVAEVAGPVAELVVVAVAAEVTVLVAEVAADVTGAAAAVLVPDPVLVAAEVPEPELVLVPVAVVAELVVVPVTAEVTEPMADVTEPVAEVSGPVAVGGAVAACAWRENASKATMIPAATIATCTARRAMSRTIGCGMSSSRTTGDRPDPARSTCQRPPNTRGANFAWNRIFAIRREMYCSATTVQDSSESGKGPRTQVSELTANSALPNARNPS